MLRSPLPGATALLREKENNRAKKWREMAVVRKMSERGDEGGRGGGCEWGFVTGDPKLISRTWKGIPDCWRAAAWHAFLTASRKRRGIGRGDGELVEMYAEFITRPSADDVQIDLDVPRTINSHIMFRRRYRGGQRLLFRVLHALSLYFPAMGYVQGMASLAATLLCYYDEETAFVMLIRMFELRGLEKLYQAGFGGLMSALEEFENGWIRGGAVSRKLNHLGIGPTTYGTRWYLTLFNYSMPFPAQLRVWDVFMLLGDPDVISESKSVSSPLGTAPPAAPGGESAISADEGFGGTLDILHATSAALIDSMKDIIVRSDFEGAMKVLTSWIPVKDEELLMKVAKSEWKMRKRRRGGGGGAAGGAHHHHPGRASLGT
ncbi:RabGAP/TBC [Morchella conica CCBAS932]|uniref:RabGAP/TBC n=2 Tax=Morchella sect. Distantes TaxID=1051054 RepID=A0A3N4KNI6_9PEZI|nr:RabGAP/TBC [Morchella conica CCBAS932]